MKHIKLFNENFQDYSKDRTSAIAIKLKGKLLIIQRGSTAPWMPLKWSLVGGGIDGNETPLEAAYRECKEEIKMKPLNVKEDKKSKLNTKDIGVIHFFTGEIKSDKVDLKDDNIGYDENVDYKFISASEIDDYDYVPYVKDFIKKQFNL